VSRLNEVLSRLGALGVLGLGVLLFCLPFYFSALRPAERELDAQGQAAQRLRARGPFHGVAIDDRAAELLRFYTLLRRDTWQLGYLPTTAHDCLIQPMIDRINEGATLDDFKAVINKKCSQWLNDAKMAGNLRPATLFAADKFEGYLQEAKRNKTATARPTETRMLQGIELLGFGLDVLTKFDEDKFQEFCAKNKVSANDIEAIRLRAKRQ